MSFSIIGADSHTTASFPDWQALLVFHPCRSGECMQHFRPSRRSVKGYSLRAKAQRTMGRAESDQRRVYRQVLRQASTQTSTRSWLRSSRRTRRRMRCYRLYHLPYTVAISIRIIFCAAVPEQSDIFLGPQHDPCLTTITKSKPKK
jgi:hypothetical protein